MSSSAQRRLLELTHELETASRTQKKKALKSLVDLLRDDGSKYLHALDETSRSLSRGGAASASAADTDVDWCTVLMLALTCVQAEKGTKARTPGPVIELWQLIQFLFESAERSGHFLSKPIIDACMQEVITILHLDAAASSGSSSAASAEAKDPLKIQGSIAALSSILDRIFSFAPYTADLPSEYFHDLFALFSNTLTTMSKLTTSELQMPNAAILALIKPHSHFPDSFLGLYQAPAAAVAILAHMMQQYPFTTASANSTASAAARKFLSAHVFPFFLSLFTLRIPDNLLTKLLSGLNSLLDNHVASHLALFRDFAYKFIYAMMQPGAWPKSTTVKQQLVRFVNIVMRLARQLPFNNTLRIVEELDTGHPLYRLLYRELDSDQLFTLVGVPQDHADPLQLDESTHAFLCLCSHVVYQVQLQPEPTHASSDEAAMNADVDSSDLSDAPASARKRRKLDSDVGFSMRAFWDHFNSPSSVITSQRLLSWIKFLYVFLGNYPRLFTLPAQGELLLSLIVGLMRASERTKADVKLWSLAALSRIASACHLNDIQLAHPPSADTLRAYPSAQRAQVQSQYDQMSLRFGELVDLLLKKHLFDERRAISRTALALLTKLATYQLLAPTHVPIMQTVFDELPSLRQQSAAVSSGGRLSSQIVELKKEALLSPSPRPPPARMHADGSAAAAATVKMEYGGGGGIDPALPPLQMLLTSEVDMVTLRFLLAYLQRFELTESTATASAASPHVASASPHPAAMRRRAHLTRGVPDTLGESDLLRWILGFRIGSPLFSPLHHSLRSGWSTSQWFAATILALNRLPVCASQPSGVCLEEEFSEDVRLPSPLSRFVHASRPQQTWLKADMGGVNWHLTEEMRAFFVDSQFVPLVSTETTPAEVALYQLPSICCLQHEGGPHRPLAANATMPQLSSASTARASSLRLLTLSIISDHLASLAQSVRDRTAGRDLRDHRQSEVSNEFDSDTDVARQTTIKFEDACFAVRGYLHYSHILCSLAHASTAAEDAAQAAARETRLTLMTLSATCWQQITLLTPHLLTRVESPATTHLLAYARHLLTSFQSVFCEQLANGKLRCDSAVQPALAAFEASCFKVILYLLEVPQAGRGRRRLEFDASASSSAASSSVPSGSSLHAGIDSCDPTEPLLDTLISLVVLLLGWRVLAPVNALADVKRYLDRHMGARKTVHESTFFYRLAHLHAVAKSASHTPNPTQDLLYYLAYLSEEFVSRPPTGSSLAVANKDLLQFRALGLFLDLGHSIQAEAIEFSEAEEKRVQKVWEDIFVALNMTVAKQTSPPLHRYNRVLKAHCGYIGAMAGLTNNWSLVTHLALDIASADFIIRLFAATQVRAVLSLSIADPIYLTFEKKILSALSEDKSSRITGESHDRRESIIMTLLAFLAHMGISMPQRERTVLLHMCLLWRERPAARPIIALVYQQLADCLHYQPRSISASAASGVYSVTSVSTSQLRARSSSLFPPSATSLLDDHFDFIMSEWLVRGHAIADFPRELISNGADDAGTGVAVPAVMSLDAFLKQYQARIAPILVIHHDTLSSTMTLLLGSLGVDLPTLLKKHFPVCCARFYAIYSQSSNDDADLTASFLAAATACLNFLKNAMQERKSGEEQEFNTYYHSKLAEMLFSLIDLVVIEPVGTKVASYGLVNFTTSLTQLAKADKMDVPHHLCAPTHDRLQSVLLYLRVRIASEFRSVRQWRLVEIARSIILDHVGPFLSTPAVWRPILDFLLWMMPEFDARFPSHAQECVLMLSEVAEKLIVQVTTAPAPAPPAASAPPSTSDQRRVRSSSKSHESEEPQPIVVPTRMPPAEMMIHIRHIITAMIDYSEAATHTDTSSGERKSSEEPVAGTPQAKIPLVSNLILGLIRSLPASLHSELSMLPPFPSHPLLADLASVYGGLSRGRNLAEEIICFLINVRSSSNPKEGAAGLAHLLTVMRAKTSELNQLLQPVPPSLRSLGMEFLSLHGDESAASRRATLSAKSAALNPIISVDGRNACDAADADAADVVSDINNSIRVSNRILSSPDRETSGHWGFDLIAPLIGALCAFCSWSQADDASGRARRGGAVTNSHRIRMLAVQCLGEIGAVDPRALNGHNSRIFRNANPLPPIARAESITPDVVHPFAAALLTATAASPAANAARLHAAWYGRWYAVGGGLQAAPCKHRELKSDPQAFANQPHHLLILYLLDQYYRSANAHVAQMAHHTLANLVCPADPNDPNPSASSQSQMLAAMSQLDPLTQAYLCTFPPAKFKSLRPVLKSRSKSDDLESDAWELSGRSFDDWICKLTRFLLTKRVRDPFLSHCAGLASHLPEFAARLMPFVLYDVLQQCDEAVTQMIALRTNSLVAGILRPPRTSASSPVSVTLTPVSPDAASSGVLSSNSIAALKLLLAALQYVREQCLVIHRQPIPPLTSRHQPPPPRAAIDTVHSIDQHFHVQLDLIQLAQAAQKCDMYATSLLYLEQWHVRTYGRLNSTSAESETQFKKSLLAARRARSDDATSPPPPAVEAAGVDAATDEAQDDRSLYHQLLLEVYRHVVDVDGIYGALHSRELMDDVGSDLLVAEHEGKFETAMQIYDSIFQRTYQDSRERDRTSAAVNILPPAIGGGIGDARISLSAAHTGLVRSLQQLGCTHLVDRYMHDLSDTDPTAYGAIADVHYEAAWRTANWDLQTQTIVQPMASTDGSAGAGLQTSLFHGLRSLHGLTVQHRNLSSFTSALTDARSRLVQKIACAGPETPEHVFPSIVHLQLLADMEKAWDIMDCAANTTDDMETDDSPHSSSSATASSRFASFERVGRDRLFLLFNDFDMVEPILALRGVILQLARQPAVLATHLRFVAAFARQSNRRVVGAHAIRDGASDPHIPLLNKLSLKLESAQLSWSEGGVDSAIRAAKHVVQAAQSLHRAAVLDGASGAGVASSSSLEDTIKLLVDASCLAAEWMSKSHSEASSVIQSYLKEASQVLTASQANSDFLVHQHHRCFYQLACFMDRLFQTLYSKSQSSEHEAARAIFHGNEEKIRQLNESMQDPQVQLVLRARDSTEEKIISARQVFMSKQLYIRRLEKEHAVDAQQNQLFDRSLAQALEHAILNYANCLRDGDKFDTQVVYRLIALWFNHYAAAPYTAEKLSVVRQIDAIPSRKFVPLVYQIASRLSLPGVAGITPEQKLFRTNIHDLIKRMILDHPYHALYQVFALAHGDQVSRVNLSVAGGVEMNEHRIRAAQDLLSELKKLPAVRDLVVAQEKLIVQYIALGGYKFASRSMEFISLSTTPLGSLKARDLAIVPVPTITIPVRSDCNYRSTPRGATGDAHAATSAQSSVASDSPIVTIVSFDPRIHLATSGVNVPLIIELLCSDGHRHKQLLKSADDLRQDATMEQLFKLVNELLSVHRETSTRQLHIRTYNVVPLTPGVGLVEWVINTTSLAECLVSDYTGAHARYARPGQKRQYRQALTYLRECHEARHAEEYARRFDEVIADFQPVFHRFFLEMFPAPSEWLARRTAYTRSVAVTSIVGFVVGLGDRHIHNILFDLHTAELIHIDLGVAFDMGIVLKTPEIVPFRLTRDMVDAMGVTGYEGGFRTAAEETMRVMRDNREMMLTVLEVFLVDPLYKWALSPAKIQQLRPLPAEDEAAVSLSEEKSREVVGDAAAANSAVNSGASRAMFNVKQRLAGAQHKEQLSVEGQVNALIHEATDMERLAKMYYGWSAFV